MYLNSIRTSIHEKVNSFMTEAVIIQKPVHSGPVQPPSWKSYDNTEPELQKKRCL